MKKYIVLAALAVIWAGNASAQVERSEDGEIRDAEVIIEKNRNIELPEANRNFEKISIPVKQGTTQPQQYNYNPYKATLEPIMPKVRALVMKQDPLKKLYSNYIEAGLGNYGTTYLQGLYNSKREENYSYGVQLKHLASARGPVDGTNSGTSENLANIYGNYFSKHVIAGGSLGYQRDRYSFYGYDRSIEKPSKDSIMQVFQTFKVRATLENANKKSPFHYNTGIGYSIFTDRFDAREDEFSFDLNSKYSLKSGSAIILNADIALTERSDSAKQNRNFVAVRPAYVHQQDNFVVTAGANIAYENDSVANSNNIHIYPNINVDFGILPERVTAYAGVTGDMQKNTLRSFAQGNPFLAPDVKLLHTNKMLELYGGIKGNIANKVVYNTRLAFQNFRNMPFFINSLPDSSKFVITYDNGTTTVLNFLGEVSYQHAETFRIGLSSEFFNYNVSNLQKPWHRPAFKGGLITSYNLRNKIFFHNNIYYNSSIFALNPNTKEAVKLDGILDWNFKVDYSFSERISAFVSLDNILSQKNPRYLYYPTRGRMIMLGATFSL
jgi:hypothetical protein